MVQRLELARIEEAPKPPPPPPPVAPDLTPVTPQRPPSRPASPSSQVDLLLHGGGAFAGAATALGGGGGIRWWPASSVGLRAALGGREGHIAEADASTTTVFAAVGPSYRLSFGTTLEVGARTDFVILHHAARRTHAGVETTHARWLGGVDLLLEAGWAMSSHLGIVMAGGGELAFGSTSVSVGGAPVAELPMLRGVAELGVRIRF